jgi:hypothetical protein
MTSKTRKKTPGNPLLAVSCLAERNWATTGLLHCWLKLSHPDTNQISLGNFGIFLG